MDLSTNESINTFSSLSFYALLSFHIFFFILPFTSIYAHSSFICFILVMNHYYYFPSARYTLHVSGGIPLIVPLPMSCLFLLIKGLYLISFFFLFYSFSFLSRALNYPSLYLIFNY